VDHTVNGEEGFHLFSKEEYDAAVVDIMLPAMDGITMVRSLRTQGIHTPVIFLSAKRSVDDRVTGLQAGGDDYLVKPFAFSELLARIRALIRRRTNTDKPTHLTAGGIEMDLLKRTVTMAEHQVQLQPREFSLLEFLMRNAGMVVSKVMIMEHVWDFNFDPQTNVVEASMCRLRTKLEKGLGISPIRTVRGVGYVLE
jgi:DNA-binding response OmpR family regulator